MVIEGIRRELPNTRTHLEQWQVHRNQDNAHQYAQPDDKHGFQQAADQGRAGIYAVVVLAGKVGEHVFDLARFFAYPQQGDELQRVKRESGEGFVDGFALLALVYRTS